MGKQSHRNVTTAEFAAFVMLLDHYGASTVGALLCAYGSCRDPKEDDAALVVDSGAAQEDADNPEADEA
jgi:hypothetical protein